MQKRVFIFDEMEPVAATPRAGHGTLLGRAFLERGESFAPGSPFVASAVNALQPGAAIGLHRHIDDEEAYFVLSGEGEYIDNEGKRHKLKKGDAAFCCKGEEHGLDNIGTEPLIIAAVIVK